MARTGKRVEVEIGVRNATPGAITKWSSRLRQAFEQAEKGAARATQKTTLMERAAAKLPGSFQRAGGLMGAALEKVGRKWDRLRERVVRGTRRMVNGIGRVGRALTSLKGLVIGYIGLRLGGEFLKTADSAQRMRIALDQLTNGRGEEWFQKINEWAFRMPINTQKATDAYIKMRAYGLEPTIAQMTTLVDSTIGLGKTEQELGRVARALGQIQAKGKLSAEEVNQLAEAGINAKEMLAAGFGVTTAELSKLMEKGIEARLAIEVLFEQMEYRFGGASSKMVRKYSGLTATIKSYWTELQRWVMESGLMGYIEKGLGGIVDKLDELRASGALQEFAQNVSDYAVGALKKLQGWVESAVGWWTRHGEAVTSVVGSTYQAITSIIGTGLKAVEGGLSLIIPDPDKMQTAAKGFSSIAKSIGTIADKLAGVPTEVWAALAGFMVAGPWGAAAGALAVAGSEGSITRELALQRKRDAQGGWLISIGHQSKPNAAAGQAQSYYSGMFGDMSGLAALLLGKDKPAVRKPVLLGGKSGKSGISAQLRKELAQVRRYYRELEKREIAWQRTRETMRQKGMTATERSLRQLELEYDSYYQTLDKYAQQDADTATHYEEYRLQLSQRYTLDREQILEASRKREARQNKGFLAGLIESWTDIPRNIKETTVNLLRSVQAGFAGFFTSLVEDGRLAWDDLWNSFKAIGVQAIAQTLTIVSTNLMGQGLAAIFPSLSGVGADKKKDGASLSDMPSTSMLSSLKSIFSGPNGLSSFGSYGGLGDSLFTWGAPTLDPLTGLPISMPGAEGLSGMGLAAGAGIGALSGGLTSSLIYEGEGYSGIGGTLGGAGGGMAGAAIGTMIFPGVGTVIGALLGGALGGAGGGGIGSMFGVDDTAEREANAAKFAELATQILKNEGDHETYMSAIQEAHLSDNRVGFEKMNQLYAAYMTRKDAQWFVPTPEQIGSSEMHGMDDDEMKRYQLYGGEVEDADGALGLKELLANAGDWQPFRDALAALSNETADELGGALSSIRLAAMDWGLSMADLLPNISKADWASGAWKEKLEGLTAATLIQNAADAERAQGLSELEVVQNSVMRSISALTGYNDMDQENRQSMIDLLQEDTGRRRELLDAAARLREVEELLLGSYEMSDAQVDKLAKEYSTLNDKLGLNKSVAGKAATAAEQFAKAMTEKVVPAFRKVLEAAGQSGGSLGEYHTGGLVLHSGGFVQQALSRGLITQAGGRLHSGGQAAPWWPSVAHGEVAAILRRREFVVREEAVNPFTLPHLMELNRSGKVPQPPAVPQFVAPPPPQHSATPAMASGGKVELHVYAGDVNVGGDVIGEGEAVERIAQAAKEAATQGAVEAISEAQAAGVEFGAPKPIEVAI